MKFHSLNNVSIYQAEGQSPFLLKFKPTHSSGCVSHLLWKFGAQNILLCISSGFEKSQN